MIRSAVLVLLGVASLAGASAAADAPAPPPRGPLALEATDGSPLPTALQEGERALVLHFWASWCPECVLELPRVERLSAGCAASGVRVLLVNVAEDADTARRFAAEHGVSGAIALDPNGAVWRETAPRALPANVVWTAEGLRAEAGPKDEAAWKAFLAPLGCAGDSP